jgi:hypothetical protein
MPDAETRMPTEEQIDARIALLEGQARRAMRRSHMALVAALAGPTAVQVRRLIGVAEAARSNANTWALILVLVAVAALALAVWFRHGAWRLRQEILTLSLLRDAATGRIRNLR